MESFDANECQLINSFFYILSSSHLARILFSFIVIVLFKELTMGICHCKNKLTGKIVVITGGNSGVGLETAVELARRGAKIYLGCRSKARAALAVQDIVARSGCEPGQIKVLELDLSFLKSVRKFAEDFLAAEKQLDILVNNAGMIGGQMSGQSKLRQLSKDKLELVMQTNYFGHFLLTHLLRDALKKSDDGRVINVSSLFNMQGVIDVDNLNGEISFDSDKVYANSKLANIMFTKALATRWASDGIKSYAVHPGFVRTNIFSRAEPFKQQVNTALAYLVGKNQEQGAQTSVHCSVAADVVNGGFYMDCRQSTWFCNRAAENEELVTKLWNKTTSILKL